ncbi:MAG: ferrous iron transporter B, partial [Desulfobacterales bacterium]|nr:ferrous iron transporter B [Desulfobacterales bacterium]
VMELPPYRVPMLKSLIIHMWDRSKMFLKKMGGIILIGSVVVWALSAFPRNSESSFDYNGEIEKIKASYEIKIEAGETDNKILESKKQADIREVSIAQRAEQVEKSYMGRMGKTISPIFAPLGIDWRGGVALLTGFVAKEIVVSTMAVLHAAKEESDALKTNLLKSAMTPLSALSMMAFVLLYLPCLATVAAIRRETGSLKWMFFSIVYNTSVAWFVAFLVYQGGRALGV